MLPFSLQSFAPALDLLLLAPQLFALPPDLLLLDPRLFLLDPDLLLLFDPKLFQLGIELRLACADLVALDLDLMAVALKFLPLAP
ncbi:MAG: hypothetical protein DMF89_16000 [Acidobacteria bacterium]|nr:MAG: hypothetical protein DMF90_15205 [Acidobacteriota bacterium]PYR48393.1 MAG: hypothetical protein DMF89_16000 [Acidobacteriota bacterium]